MRATKFSASITLALILLGTVGGTQTSTDVKPPANKKVTALPATQKSLDQEVQKYQDLLNDVDISSDPDLRHAVYVKWAEASCKNKQSKLQQLLGTPDKSLSESLYSACMKRMMAQESGTTTTAGDHPQVTTHVSTPPKTDPGEQPSVTLPAGCSSLPNLTADFNTEVPAQYPTPSTAQWNSPAHWVQLNPNSSGGEKSAKATVWVGYVNRLRYTVTLRGVVTSIAAPSVPQSILPTLTPQPTPTPSKFQAVEHPTLFDQFNGCFTSVSDGFVKFQGALATEEARLNDSREAIGHRLASLSSPIVDTIDEARAAADYSVLPTNEIPSFPIGDIKVLRGLLDDFIPKYAQFAQWAQANGETATFQDVTARAAALSTAVNNYLVSTPDTSTSGAGSTKNTSGTGSGNTGNSTATGAGTKTATGGAAGGTTTGQGTGTTGSKDTGTATHAGTGSSTNTGTPGGTGTGANGAPKTDTPGSIPVGPQEVQLYQANRDYIKQWIEVFTRVATAPPGYFVVTFKPQCGGWFGQGTSTQMQLTIADSLNPTQNSGPTNIDKVVCQPALTVTNGLGLSFIPDRTPAFVAGVKKDAQGNPVLDASGNPTIIQTLGYSSVAPVRPAYAVQANWALVSLPKWFELHWGLGAMLTAATGGATTDIITGPAFSFKKRAFFVSPVYDLGLRTTFQSGFNVGMPQGNLTSPPTQQTWKSGFAITFTFPFTPGTNTTNSSNSTTNSGAGTKGTGTATPGSGGVSQKSGSKPGNTGSDASN